MTGTLTNIVTAVVIDSPSAADATLWVIPPDRIGYFPAAPF